LVFLKIAGYFLIWF